jgi:hypothetical protein
MASLSFTGRPWRDRSVSACFLPTETDLRLYRDLAQELKAPPNAHICRYLGAPGAHLVFLGDSGPGDWRRLQEMAASRWPDLPSPGRMATDGTELETVPERIVYESLRPLLRSGMAIDLHQPIRPDDAGHRADLTLRLREARIFIEVAGCCGSDRITRNDNEKRWLERLDRRLRYYHSLSIPPVCIWLDLLARPQELRTLCRDLADRIILEGAGR